MENRITSSIESICWILGRGSSRHYVKVSFHSRPSRQQQNLLATIQNEVADAGLFLISFCDKACELTPSLQMCVRVQFRPGDIASRVALFDNEIERTRARELRH